MYPYSAIWRQLIGLKCLSLNKNIFSFTDHLDAIPEQFMGKLEGCILKSSQMGFFLLFVVRNKDDGCAGHGGWGLGESPALVN